MVDFAGAVLLSIRLISLGQKREYFRAVQLFQQQFHLLIPQSTDEFIPHNTLKRIYEIADVWGTILLIHSVSSLYDEIKPPGLRVLGSAIYN